MKKTLLILGNFSLISSPIFMTISCNQEEKSKQNKMQIWDLGFFTLDKINSLKELEQAAIKWYESNPIFQLKNLIAIFETKIKTSIKSAVDFINQKIIDLINKLSNSQLQTTISFREKTSQLIDDEGASLRMLSYFHDLFKMALKANEEFAKFKAEIMQKTNSLIVKDATKSFTNEVFKEWAQSKKITLAKYIEYQSQQILKAINLVEKLALLLKQLG